jgi:hypothetical protein
MGTLSNKASSSLAVNANTLAVVMNNYIVSPCVLNRQWGFYETNEYIIQLEYSNAGGAKEGGVPKIEEEPLGDSDQGR